MEARGDAAGATDQRQETRHVAPPNVAVVGSRSDLVGQVAARLLRGLPQRVANRAGVVDGDDGNVRRQEIQDGGHERRLARPARPSTGQQ